MSLYKNQYYISLGERINIFPNKTSGIYFINCKNLPHDFYFERDTGVVYGISLYEQDITFIVKYSDRMKSNKIICEKIQISVKPISKPIESENIDYSLIEHNIQEIEMNNTIKKSIDDLSCSNSMKYMHINGANTFVYKV
jgi:hypothetical protein